MDVRVFLDVKHITSNELLDFGLGSLLHLEFTCILRSVQYTIYFRIMLCTFNDVHDGWAKEMSEDGVAGINFSEPCHHVVRFVDRAFVIEPVELQVVVVIVRDALEANLRSFDVLQCDKLPITRVSALYPMARVES